jgi:TPP-dependent pyruvate/acetoin dehydrogenase alpha subunit
MDPADRADIDARIEKEIEEALAWAERSPLPDGKSQREGVYATPI